jgi:hypothetical protein
MGKKANFKRSINKFKTVGVYTIMPADLYMTASKKVLEFILSKAYSYLVT